MHTTNISKIATTSLRATPQYCRTQGKARKYFKNAGNRQFRRKSRRLLKAGHEGNVIFVTTPGCWS